MCIFIIPGLAVGFNCVFSSPAVKEAAVQRRHNLYRDSIVLTNSDPNLHLLEENPPIDWAGEYGGGQAEVDGEQGGEGDALAQKRRRMKQVVSMIQEDGTVLPESCLEVPGVEDIPEEESEGDSDTKSSSASEKEVPTGASAKEEVAVATSKDMASALPNGTTIKEEKTTNPSVQEGEPRSPDTESKLAIESAIQEIEDAVQEEESAQNGEINEPTSEEKEQTATLINEEAESAPEGQTESKPEPSSNLESKITPPETEEHQTKAEEPTSLPTQEQSHEPELQQSTPDSSSPHHDDSGFQSPANEVAEEEEPQAATATAETEMGTERSNDSETGEQDAGKGADH